MKNTVFVLWLGLAVADIGWAQNEPYKNPDLSPRERAEDVDTEREGFFDD